MRILITGGAGCLGASLVDHWLPLDHEVAVIDNFATGHRGSLPAHDALNVIEGSVADADLVQRTVSAFEPDWVVHAAAAYKDPDDWSEDVGTNVLGAINVVRHVSVSDRRACSICKQRSATGVRRPYRYRSLRRSLRSPATGYPRSPRRAT